ncbi:hypothetical protein NA57DRAFT_30565 [Rhizodiscina lignyota]|uniref:ubiquitinyl hydrolase 1 n=1 Tax=Rhizodiscina lignyota TaxID=1504668 RepID=A0A9P4MGU8_9PEZI|nr:hypothetical protein NA57DRAFT_30565 [Rhizodiscina lignyota]
MASRPVVDTGIVEAAVNHIALPPILPGKEDGSPNTIKRLLVDYMLGSTAQLQALRPNHLRSVWEQIHAVVQDAKDVISNGRLQKDALLKKFRSLDHGRFLILHVTEQNAGLLVYRDFENPDEVTFEGFEAAAPCEPVLAAENALKWDFPTYSVSIPSKTFDDDEFQDQLATFLEHASLESINRFAAHTGNSTAWVSEIRDTTDPSLITNLLMTLLEALGHQRTSPLLRKRVRDEVFWKKGMGKPWRRSPYWLVLKVGIQRFCYQRFGGGHGHAYYKFLICGALAHLLANDGRRLRTELRALLNVKLARRLAKIEVDKDNAPLCFKPVYESLFSELGNFFQEVLGRTRNDLETIWSSIRGIVRPPSYLPRRADTRDLTLTLHNSMPYIRAIFSWAPEFDQLRVHPVNLTKATTTAATKFAHRYFELTAQEMEIEVDVIAPMEVTEENCIALADQIEQYLDDVGEAYNYDPLQKSAMLLTVMQLWVILDQIATGLYELLLEFNPGCVPSLFDVLLAPHRQDMHRLQAIQNYIKERLKQCKYPNETIFDSLSFAERYFDCSPSAPKLQSLFAEITALGDAGRVRKEQEWRAMNDEYNSIMAQSQFASCTCLPHSYGCVKCGLEAQARRMRINVHEHPLPSRPTEAKAVIFEMCAPEAFQAYRNTTWRIFGTLTRELQSVTDRQVYFLRDYSALKDLKESSMDGICLASVKKSWIDSHYRQVNFPVPLSEVCLPNRFEFGLYDSKTKVWTANFIDFAKLSHHVAVKLPGKSPFRALYTLPQFAPDSNGRTSNEIIASQTECPATMSTHEFTTFQSLQSGKFRRWVYLLIELGCQNINFSNEACVSVTNMLVDQAGPEWHDDLRRKVHHVFKDANFCNRLLEQLRLRLENISSNWREYQQMELIISILLRTVHLGPTSVMTDAMRLLLSVRSTTLEWARLLRKEIQMCTDMKSSQSCSSYGFWAALLCKRTFSVYVGHEIIEHEELCQYFECSIALQDNLTADPDNLPSFSKHALVRDLKTTFRMRNLLRRSLGNSLTALSEAVDSIWPRDRSNAERTYSSLSFLDSPQEWWVHATIKATSRTRAQLVHYHLLHGTLLIDGMPLGKLPPDIRNAPVVKQLFGDQNLMIYPSSLHGMSHMLALDNHGHQIHLGFRNGDLVLRAQHYGSLLEFIQADKFGTPTDFDLPENLISNCHHWLDLHTGVIEIRQGPEHWKPKAGNWKLDVHKRVAQRRESILVDPRSRTFDRVASAFKHFEDRYQLTVFMPKSRLSVELRRLELQFFVNERNLLECRQLSAEIDEDQDAGTFYGLMSMLVLREVVRGHGQSIVNKNRRSILTPLGPPDGCTRRGDHVSVILSNRGSYGIYTINQSLGRLECAPEPRLLYHKAYLHAVTSFILPDPLTGFTGSEMAFRDLQSGQFQPWAPLSPTCLTILNEIRSLSPKRQYYPRDRRTMQVVEWNQYLSTAVQRDELSFLVQDIVKKSETLSRFHLGQVEYSNPNSPSEAHLTRRAGFRRRLFERIDSAFDPGFGKPPDMEYVSRGRRTATQARKNVYEVVSILRSWPSALLTPTDFAGILQRYPTIGGFVAPFSPVLLSDTLEAQHGIRFGELVELCRSCGISDVYRLMFLTALLSFRNDVDMDVMRTFIAFAIFQDLKDVIPPPWSSYTHFRADSGPSFDYLVQMMKPSAAQYAGDTGGLGEFLDQKTKKRLRKEREQHETLVQQECETLAKAFLQQWPSAEIDSSSVPRMSTLDVSRIKDVVQPEWTRLFHNRQLSNYVQHIQKSLDKFRTEEQLSFPMFETTDPEVFPSHLEGQDIPKLSVELVRKPFSSPSNGHSRTTALAIHKTGIPKENDPPVLSFPNWDELKTIILKVMNSPSSIRQQYGEDLLQSLEDLKAIHIVPKVTSQQTDLDFRQLQQRLVSRFRDINMAFEANDPRAKWLKPGLLWPPLSLISILETLRSTWKCSFGSNMKNAVTDLAVTVTQLQRALRLEDANLKKNRQRIEEEQKNKGHTNWKPMEKPDWVLLEIDADMMIRPEQVEVAIATISPESGDASLLQMNMGQGKTSVIMPMVAAVLADSKRLLRLIVPKALLQQTSQLLSVRLGCLLGREIRHVPFSRKTSNDNNTIKSFFEIHRDIRAKSGAIIGLPEHLLSFMLSGLQRLADGRVNEARTLIGVESWMRRWARDVLDESDHILSARTQLIYPSGSQKTLDGHPHRWETVQSLLGLVAGHYFNLKKAFPFSMEVIERRNAFPMAYFLRPDAEQALLGRLINDVLSGQVPTIPIQQCSREQRSSIRRIISNPVVAPVDAERVRNLFPDKPSIKQSVYLVRGLLIHRILLLALKKRYNVQYGIDPRRDPVAVPFHAKGVPSDQAEWGHPDVGILFTCLSFYYGGLSSNQLRQSLTHILQLDDPASEYDMWTQSSPHLPESLRDFNLLNLDDEAQLKALWTHFRYNVPAINCFLNEYVFPVHAKQFAVKIQASGWDIILRPLDKQQNGSSGPLTTGFSGTNDARLLLPMTVAQRDLKGLSHTNAEVLSYLFEPRNRGYMLASSRLGKRLSEIELLAVLKNERIRVLIDAGAQILEMDNVTLVRNWLKVDTEPPAAVYFNSENKLYVYYRGGNICPLAATPFAENLSDCLIYLDESHCRGTDLRLPANAKGALTLGIGLSKDSAVQAAMRLRQLGTTQSLSFLVPPEVHQSILDVCKKSRSDWIDSADVVHWLLEQSCVGIESLQPLFFAQGSDYCQRMQAAKDFAAFLDDESDREAYLAILRQPERQTIQKLYQPKTTKKATKDLAITDADLKSFMDELHVRRKGFHDSGNTVQSSALQEVEQEREEERETEAVREVQRPVPFAPHGFGGVHKDILEFCKTGYLVANSQSYDRCLEALRRGTALGVKHGINIAADKSRLFVSREFMQTVKIPGDRLNDDFLRSTHWILWSEISQTALLLVPEETEVIMRLLKEWKNPQTHLLAYSAPTTRKTMQFNNLNYYATPPLPDGWKAPLWLKIQVGLFAGASYFSYEEYEALLEILGLNKDTLQSSDSEEDGDAGATRTDGVVAASDAQPKLTFTAKPTVFLGEWLAIRRRGQESKQTPMGFLVQHKPLHEDHHFFAPPGVSTTTNASKVKKSAAKGPKLAVDVAENEESEDDDVFYDAEAFPEDDDVEDEDEKADHFDEEAHKLWSSDLPDEGKQK